MTGEEKPERDFFAEGHVAPSAGRPAAKLRAAKEPKHYDGHRDRLRQRFAASPDNALPDYELLELLLFRLIPRADTKPIAKALLARFGSLAEVLGAPENLLTEVKGVGDSVALDLKIIAATARRLTRGAIMDREILSSWQAVLDYCRAAMAFESREHFRILFLDKKNGLIADEVQQTGTVDHTPVYPREVVRRALELSATAVILVHNHPSGDTTPSAADITMTREIIAAGKLMGISVHDHIIIGRKGYASMKGLRLI